MKADKYVNKKEGKYEPINYSISEIHELILNEVGTECQNQSNLNLYNVENKQIYDVVKQSNVSQWR